MAISELTKQVILQHKTVLKSQWDALKAQRDEHLAAAAVIKEQMQAIKAQADALTADIPEPVVVEP